MRAVAKWAIACPGAATYVNRAIRSSNKLAWCFVSDFVRTIAQTRTALTASTEPVFFSSAYFDSVGHSKPQYVVFN